MEYTRSSLVLLLGGIGLSREGSTQSLNEDDDYREHNMALRYRLYSRLDPGGHQLVCFDLNALRWVTPHFTI